MKLLSLLLFLAFAGSTMSMAQDPPPPREPVFPPGTINHYYLPSTAFKVTIESESGLVSVVNIPLGVFLNVQFYEEKNPEYHEWKGGARTFRGDIVIRARREDEIESGESNAAHDLMAKSPFQISLSNAVVLVEKI